MPSKNQVVYWVEVFLKTQCQVNMGTSEFGHPGYPFLKKNGYQCAYISVNMGTGVFIFMIKMGIPPQN